MWHITIGGHIYQVQYDFCQKNTWFLPKNFNCNDIFLWPNLISGKCWLFYYFLSKTFWVKNLKFWRQNKAYGVTRIRQKLIFCFCTIYDLEFFHCGANPNKSRFFIIFVRKFLTFVYSFASKNKLFTLEQMLKKTQCKVRSHHHKADEKVRKSPIEKNGFIRRPRYSTHALIDTICWQKSIN